MPDAVEVAIEAAFLAELAEFAATNSLTVAYPNVAFTPPAPSATAKWLRATFLPVETVAPSVGNNSDNIHSGLFQVDCFYGPGAGELAPARLAAQVIAYFKRGSEVTKDGFTAVVLRPPSRFDLLKDDPWVFVPVRIPYVCYAPNPA